MQEKRGRKYIKAIVWFSALWGVKEFILEPLISKLKDEQEANKQIKNG